MLIGWVDSFHWIHDDTSLFHFHSTTVTAFCGQAVQLATKQQNFQVYDADQFWPPCNKDIAQGARPPKILVIFSSEVVGASPSSSQQCEFIRSIPVADKIFSQRRFKWKFSNAGSSSATTSSISRINSFLVHFQAPPPVNSS